MSEDTNTAGDHRADRPRSVEVRLLSSRLGICERIFVFSGQRRIRPARMADRTKPGRNVEALVQFIATAERSAGDGAAVVACPSRDHPAKPGFTRKVVAVPHELDEMAVGFRRRSSEIDGRDLDRRNRRKPLVSSITARTVRSMAEGYSNTSGHSFFGRFKWLKPSSAAPLPIIAIGHQCPPLQLD